MFSLVFSKEERQVDSDKDQQHNKYFFYSISLIMEKMEQWTTNLKLKIKLLFKRANYFLLNNEEWGHFAILVCIEYYCVNNSEYWQHMYEKVMLSLIFMVVLKYA